MKRESTIKAMGIELGDCGDISRDVASYRIAGKLVFTSGLVPRNADGSMARGKVGLDFTTEQAQEHVRNVAIQLLGALKAAAGDLDRVKQIVMLQCYANALTDYTEQSVLFNPASELFTGVFGEAGRHARFAVGMGSLPMNVPIEISLIAELE